MDSFYRATKSMRDTFNEKLNEMDKIFYLTKKFSDNFDKHIRRLHKLIISLLENNEDNVLDDLMSNKDISNIDSFNNSFAFIEIFKK